MLVSGVEGRSQEAPGARGDAKWRERHPEYAARHRQMQRERYERNKDEIRAKAREHMRKRYATDPQRVLATNRAWYERNRDRMREYDRGHRLANIEASGRRTGSEVVPDMLPTRQPGRSTSKSGAGETRTNRTLMYVPPPTNGGSQPAGKGSVRRNG
jgi:hypothetical protein